MSVKANGVRSDEKKQPIVEQTLGVGTSVETLH